MSRVSEHDLFDVLNRIADAIEALAGGEEADRFSLGALVGELRAWVSERVEDPVDAAIDEALGKMGRIGDGWSDVGESGSAAGRASVWSDRAAHSLHVVGRSATAERLRERLASNEAAGWTLRPVPSGSTPIQRLYEEIAREGRSTRARRVLEGSPFVTVEEVAAVPDDGLLWFTNFGWGTLAIVRHAISALGVRSAAADLHEP